MVNKGHELDITLPLEALGIKDASEYASKIRKEIHLAILRGITAAVNATIDYAKLIVPESHPNDTNPRPYPESYETEQLMNTYIDMLRLSLTRLKRGKTTLRTAYTIQQLGWDMVSYAEYVNDMIGVKWTKPTSESGFIQKLCGFLQKMIPLLVQQELSGIHRGSQLLYGEDYTSSPLGDWGYVTGG